MWGRSVEISAGVFQCAVDGDRWNRKTLGTYDRQLESGNMNPQINAGPTARIDAVNYKGEMYIPLPSESTFVGTAWDQLGFVRKKETEQIKDSFRVKYQQDGEQWIRDLWGMKLKCTYTAATDVYRLELYESNGTFVAAFTCKSDGKEWIQQ